MKSRILFIAFLVIVQYNYGQTYKFGKVSKEELEQKYYPLDSSANAAILYKKRMTYYDYSGTEGWKLVTKIFQRTKLYNKDGFEWATKKIDLYEGRNGRESVGIKANTYYLDNGKIQKVKLKKDGIFDEDVSENWQLKKITMPDLREGCIVEWEYTINSPYYSNIDEVVFQYPIPVQFMESSIKIPEYFKFKYVPTFYYPVKVNQKTGNRKFNFTYRESADNLSIVRTKSSNASVDLLEKAYESSEKNIPALKSEPFVNNIDNYRSKVSFEFMAYTPKNGIPKYFTNSWETISDNIYQNPRFGGQLEKSFFKADLMTQANPTAPVEERIVTAFQYVKNKIKWNGKYGKYCRDGLRKAYKDGVGDVAEVNLLLVAALKELNLKANPVLVSTRSHGVPLFPTSEGFNYVIAAVELENNVVLLDATEPYSVPNILPMRDLNWQGRIVREDGSSAPVNLYPNQHAKHTTFINAKVDDEGMVTGMERALYTNLNALNYRNNYNNVSDADMISKIEQDQGIEITELKVSNKNKIGKPIIQLIKYESEDLTDMVGDKIYISPLLFLTEKENPFKLENRNFPVDFATPWEDKVNITIEIPEGYQIESVPEQMAIGLVNNQGSYKFVTSLKNNKVQILSSLKIDTPIISPLDYESLKAFYDQLIQKQNEKIVLTKI